MKLLRFTADGQARYGAVEQRQIRELTGDPFGSLRFGPRSFQLEDVTLLSPCEPSKIVAVGVNYKAHAQEMGHRLPEEPLLFLKPPSSIVGPGGTIHYPDGVTRLDYEAELAVVIKKKATGVTPEQAPGVILGYTCLNDVTARDLQQKDKQWTRAKSFDTFAPIGPWIATDLDPSNLKIEGILNGETKQSSSTSDLIFPVFFLVSFISKIMTLLPGDVITTGTPSGVGPMQRGDTVEVAIAGIGRLTNTVR
jgi:2-keto-4-pentenoate hydratase/2-oxohepta-3-ene-1,7-dioic acid hydratase in catechol pathway